MNTTPTQSHLIFRLEALRQNIMLSQDKETIFDTARQAYDLALPVPIDLAFSYKIEGKERTLYLLANEIKSYDKSNTEIEVIQFQFASTILMLMLQFIQGSLEDMQKVIFEHQKVA